MKKTVLVLFLVLFFFLPVYSVHSADFDSYVYWVIPGTKRTIQWDVPVGGADGYEFKVWRMESSRIVYQTKLVSNSIAITWRTPGIYYPYVRSYKGPIATREFTEWVNALDPTIATVNDNPKAWAIYVPMQ